MRSSNRPTGRHVRRATSPTASLLPPPYRPVEVLGRARGRVTYLAVDSHNSEEVVIKAILEAGEGTRCSNHCSIQHLRYRACGICGGPDVNDVPAVQLDECLADHLHPAALLNEVAPVGRRGVEPGL